ncbi:MAG: nucleoside deaminase [Ruminococcaceae bacterium]|nr:nucleoside deaminase [Oscillospiraceae bacterium]
MNSKFMYEALKEAEVAAKEGEVPVGAVIVRNGEIISKAHNMREQKQNALSHAEIEAINIACEKLGSWRLDDCELYVTLEPCPMCTGAIINSRIKTVVFGAFDKTAGCMDSVINLCDYPLGNKPEIYAGICEDRCSAILKDFFTNLR